MTEHKSGPAGRKRRFIDPRYVSQERRKALVLGCILLWSVISFFAIRYFLLGTVIVQGQSMAPTLWEGEQYLVHRWVYLFRDPYRGEIVVVRDPRHPDWDVKRVVGLPGDSVRINEGAVWIDGIKLDERYLPAGTRTGGLDLLDNTYVVDTGRFFVLGDNRKASEDSRNFGAIARKDILGRIHKRQP